MPKFLGFEGDPLPVVSCQDINAGPESEGIHVVIVSPNIPKAHDDPFYRTVVPMIILWAEAEARDRAIQESLRRPLVLYQVFNREVFTLYPNGPTLRDGVVSHEARVSDANCSCSVAGLEKWP